MADPNASATPPSKAHVRSLDGIRGFAAALVFIYHYGGGRQSSLFPVRVVGELIHLGWAGVPLFFSLSGFLITGILWDSIGVRGWWRRFYARRSLRIFPLYYLSLALALTVYLASGIPLFRLKGLLVYALYLQNFPMPHFLRSPLPLTIWLEHFWSLAVEEQFYLFWPFLLILCHRDKLKGLKLAAGLWFASFAFRIGVVCFHFPIGWALSSSFGRCGELLVGAYLALAIRDERATIWRKKASVSKIFVASFVCFASLVLYALIRNFDQNATDKLMSTLGLAVLSILCMSLLALAVVPSPIQSFFEMRLLRWLGKISYGIYVYHLLLRTYFVRIANRLGPHLGYNAHLALLAVIALIGTLTVALLSFYFFESPFLRLKKKFG